MKTKRSVFTITLTQGQKAIVDERDWHRLKEHKWCAVYNKRTGAFNAMRSVTGTDTTKRQSVYMSREISGLTRGDKRRVRHIDQDTLDNRRANLRITDRFGNSWEAGDGSQSAS